MEEDCFRKSPNELLISVEDDLGSQTQPGVKHMHTGFADKLEPFRVVMRYPQQVSKTTATNMRQSDHATPLLCYAMLCYVNSRELVGWDTSLMT